MLNLRKYRRLRAVPLLLLAASAAQAQSVISVRPGLIHHVEGKVFLVDQLDPAPDFGHLRHLEEAQQLRTEKGRAEIMLDPITFLRLNEESRVEMVSAGLSDVQVRLHQGSALIDVRKKPASGGISILSGDAVIGVDHKGSFRIDALPNGQPTLRVFRGEFTAFVAGVPYEVGPKDSLLLSGAGPQLVSKFDGSEKDAFDRWNRERAAAIDQDERARQQAAHRGECGSANSACMGYPYPGGYPGVYGYPSGGYGGGPSTTMRNPAPAPSPPPASTSRGGHGGR